MPMPSRPPDALGGRLGDRPVHEHVAGQTGADRHHGVDHRGELGGALDAAASAS